MFLSCANGSRVWDEDQDEDQDEDENEDEDEDEDDDDDDDDDEMAKTPSWCQILQWLPSWNAPASNCAAVGGGSYNRCNGPLSSLAPMSGGNPEGIKGAPVVLQGGAP